MQSSVLRWTFLLTLVWSIAATARDDRGVPLDDDTTVQLHLHARSELIMTEKQLRQDREFRESLSPIARQAENIVAAIRQEEIDYFWRRPGPVGREDSERFAGMQFQKARPFILETKLWEIVQRMPKGSLLHVHSSAIVPFDIVYNALLNTEGIVISSSQPIDSEVAQRNATITFTHINTTIETVSPSIHEASYVPNTEIPISAAAASFPGGRGAFIDFLKSKSTITYDEATRHDLGVDAIWRKFQSCFGPAGAAMNYEPVLRTYLRALFEGLVDDGITWVELRSGGSSPSLIPEGEEDVDPDLDFWWRVFLEEVDKFKATEKGKEFWGVRVIWSDIRSWNRTVIIDAMKAAMQRKVTFPELFSGYDLVAQEDLGRPLVDIAPELIWFQEQTASLNISMPFFFHAGETLGDGNSTDNNLFDAVLFNSRRIGHGFSLYKHPKLMRLVQDQRVMVEVCPISSEVLRLATDVLHHPLPAMIAHGVPTAISNDDPSILGQDAPGLSFDFYQAIQGFDNLGLGGLGALAQNSVRWSQFEDQSQEDWVRDIDLGVDGGGIKAKKLKEWHEKWETFCSWIVEQYGGQYNVTATLSA
ncbi:uncharacterized protein Z518_09217 [Rhinocladiella mackenziei CBS 650.93]|uniref:adenosine deaminase n=1 Tax=Rhinocladiella mackenziei CBS 650.93 TaxID=1442369 RepID=A0A0D2IE26_9EURO|nr:uncharacterized protein Z518_09217 [Rhinocladiella mackenziei CBS 650.93]KIX01491.1 hypothetical protein Z518_09217 [Rhinocladiella mackenziei CBS 650.93]